MPDRPWFSTRATLDEVIKGRGPYRVADVFGGSGGLALGAVLEGFQLAAKREGQAATGIGLMRANRAVLGDQWSAQAISPDRWRGVTADVVTSAARDEDDLLTLIRYAARLRPGVLVLDTVPDVFAAVGIAKDLNKQTKLAYRYTSIEYNDLSFGGALNRRRELIVLSQVPFGVDRVAQDWLPVADDAVMDLLELEPTWDPQPIRRPPTWYSRALRAPEHTVDGFMTAYDYRSPLEWDWKRPGQLLSADGLFRVKGRDGHALTHREIARLMGFPDAWRLGTAPRSTDGRFLGAYWDETTSVRPARWVMRWVHRSLDGHPGPLAEYRVDVSHDWEALAYRQWGHVS